MSILPQTPTAADVLADRQDRVKRFLAARGDPNIAIPFQVLCMMLPSAHHLEGELIVGSDRRNWLDNTGTLSKANLTHAVKHAHVVDTELSILQFASLLERSHMATAVLDNAQKPITLAPSPASLLPTPLMLAVMYKAPSAFSGVSPLTAHSSFGSLSVVEALLTRGVDPCGLDAVRSTSRSIYCGSGSPSTEPPLMTPLLVACFHGRHTIAASLVQSGGVGQRATRKTLTNLLIGCALSCSIRCFMLIRRGRESVVDSILSRAVTKDGRTLLHLAVLAHLSSDTIATEHGSEDECSSASDYEDRRAHFCQLLVGLGCPVDAAAVGPSLEGDTALHLAWRTGKSALCRALVVDMMANPSICNERGELPFECHGILMSSLQIAFQGGVCNLIQDSGPQSSLLFLDVLLQWVYPQCLGSRETRQRLLNALVQPSPRNGWNALHSLCSSVYWMRHAHQSDVIRISHQICELVKLLHNEFFSESGGEDYERCWINRPVIAEVAGSLRMATPLVLAVEAGAPLTFLHLLLHHGANGTLQPDVPHDVAVPSGVRLAPSLNAFQTIATLRSPYPHIGDAAMMLLLSATATLHLPPSQPNTAPMIEPTMEVLRSFATHPTNAHACMTDLPIVQTHPYWQTFFEVLIPPADEKDRRKREANRFRQFHTGAVDALVAEIEPIPPTVPFTATRLADGSAAQFSTVPTPLVNGSEPQGAFVVVVHPEPRRAPSYLQDEAVVLPPFQVSRSESLRLRQEWSFEKRLAAILEHYDTSAMPARNFFYEQKLQQPSGELTTPSNNDEDSVVSLSEWISSQPDGSMMGSYFLVRFSEWYDVLEELSDGDAAYATMCDYTRARSLGLRRHVEHLQVDEAARQRDVGSFLGSEIL